MSQAGIGNKRSMFDSDDNDSDDGITEDRIPIVTAQDLVATASARTVDGSFNNANEDLSPSKKLKLIDMEKDDLVNSKICEQEFITETKAAPIRNLRRSARKQQTSVPTTKEKYKRKKKKQTPVHSSLVSATVASRVMSSGASDIHDLTNSDSEDLAGTVVAKATKQPISTNPTKLTSSKNQIGVREVAKISNRVLENSTSRAKATNTVSSIITSESTPIHKAEEPVHCDKNNSSGNSIISSESTSKHKTKSPVHHGKNTTSDDSIMSSGEESSKGAGVPISNSGNSCVLNEEPLIVLTAAQRARIEQNRQKALLIRQERRNKVLPPIKKSEQLEKEGKKVLRINDTKLVDTGGGFFLEEDDGSEIFSEADIIAGLRRAEEPAPLIPEDRPRCADCGNIFDSSYLFKHFDHPACDDCRDNESRHALITKTDARNEYLLQDVDLEKREPPLRFIVRKNPHNDRWGDMKLYLKLQIEKRCLEVWGTEEALEEAIAKKAQQRETSKQKKFKKKMLELRMNVRSSLYTRASKSHEHEYGEEEYHEDDDEYSKTCATCGHSYRYDKI